MGFRLSYRTTVELLYIAIHVIRNLYVLLYGWGPLFALVQVLRDRITITMGIQITMALLNLQVQLLQVVGYTVSHIYRITWITFGLNRWPVASTPVGEKVSASRDRSVKSTETKQGWKCARKLLYYGPVVEKKGKKTALHLLHVG